MTRLLSAGGALLTVLVLAALLASASPVSARADDPNSGGDITVTVVDPSASPSPSSTSGTGSGSGSGGSSQGHGSGGSGSGSGSNPSGGTGSGSGSGSGTKGSIPKWVVLSGFGGGAHAEFNPFRGWVRTSVTIANRSTTETVNGKLVFRLSSFLGGQLGPTVTREISGLRPGKSTTTTVDLDGVGQWPLVKVSAAFEQSGAGHPAAMVRESWVAGSPWLLIVIAVLVMAGLAIARIRRGATMAVLQPEAVL